MLRTPKILRRLLKKLDDAYGKIAVSCDRDLFCGLFNIRAVLRGKDVRFSFDAADNIYTAHSATHTRVFKERKQNYQAYSDGLSERGNRLGHEYLLDNIPFSPGDVVVDCGANVGDLLLFFKEHKLDVQYFAIEPSPAEFHCLQRNVAPSESFHLGLWNTSGHLDFFVSSRNADSSFFQPTKYTEVVQVPIKRLDGFFSLPIKLLKLEAEGAEPEALAGCEHLLKQVAYISADCGFERGVQQESTLAPVTNYLLTRGFELLEVRYPRIVALYRNKNLSSR